MKKKLLELGPDQDNLTISMIEVKRADFEFDFKNKKLKPELNDKPDKVSAYVISKELLNAVNAAIITGRPLLLKGEPGCGKTQLAKAVAAYVHGKELSKYYFEWHVKSRSNARDGAYQFDHVSRLRHATINEKDEHDKPKAADPTNYLSLGPMGLAFVSAPPADKSDDQAPKKTFPILLIDEIDKGDIDFPNDLLLELDEMRFLIPELQQEDKYISAAEDDRPLVVITSNDERELPPAFLRRCLYYKIPGFKNDRLEKIVNFKLEEFYNDLNLPAADRRDISPDQVKTIVQKFLDVKNSASSAKPPSTSELLDWLKLLLYQVNTTGHSMDDLINDTELQQLALKLMSS
ncbi:MAG: MoxR family ATPase [Saprospiraceae bacterium]|nr:MoxR family ATPase [Lewinella sp.]